MLDTIFGILMIILCILIAPGIIADLDKKRERKKEEDRFHERLRDDIRRSKH